MKQRNMNFYFPPTSTIIEEDTKDNNYYETINNLKRFRFATESRFASFIPDIKDSINSCTYIENLNPNSTFQSNLDLHKDIYDTPQQMKSNLYSNNWNYFNYINNDNCNFKNYDIKYQLSLIINNSLYQTPNNALFQNQSLFNIYNNNSNNNFLLKNCNKQIITNINNNCNVNYTSSHNNQNSNKRVKINSFKSLETLQQYLEGKKLIGNYIKCRQNTPILISLLKQLPHDDIDKLIELIKPKMKDIVISNNKFIQELLTISTKEQRIKIMTILKDNLVLILSNKWGNFSFQFLYQTSTTEEEQHLFLNIIKNNFQDVIMNKRANYFLQKCMHNFHHSSMDIIYQCLCMDNIKKYIVNSLSLGFLKIFITCYQNNKQKHELLKQLFLYDNLCSILEIDSVINTPKKKETINDNNNNSSGVNNNNSKNEIIPSNIIGMDFIMEVISLLIKDNDTLLIEETLDCLLKEILNHIEHFSFLSKQTEYKLLLMMLSHSTKEQIVKYISPSFMTSSYYHDLNKSDTGKKVLSYLIPLNYDE